MATSRNARRIFSMLSTTTLAGTVLTLAPRVMAACPDPDPGPLPYVSAHAPTTACTKADLQLFKAQWNDPSTKWTDLESAVKAQSAGCASCIFAKETDASWAPIVYVGNAGGAFINWGSCYEKAPGGSLACGTALEKSDLCTSIRCDSCTTQQSADSCYSSVSTAQSCGQYDFQAACPSLQTQVDTTCADVFEVVSQLCGGGAFPQDVDAGAGTDAGTEPDASTTTTPDAGKPQKPKVDAGTSGKKDASSDESEEPSGTSGTKDAGKKKATTPDAGDEDTTTSDSSSGCAQGGASPTGTIATALIAMVAAGGAFRSRRRARKR